MLSNVLKCSLPLTKQLPGAAAGKEKTKFSPRVRISTPQDSAENLALRDSKRPELSLLRPLHASNRDLPSIMGGGATCDGATTVRIEK